MVNMDSILQDIFKLLGIPAVWGGILTVTTIAIGIVLKQVIDHSLAAQLEKLKEVQLETTFLRELYADGIKTYSTQQAQGLRRAYRLVFEEDDSEFQKQLDTAIDQVMKPLRDHLGILDEPTKQRIYDIHNKLQEFNGRQRRELIAEKNDFFNLTVMAEQFVKADKIAFRLGLISHPLEERSMDGK